ncbi:MAG TPA: ABC transporter permease [Chitinophaga sp.]
MLKNYIRIAWRNLLKNKLHSAINITGLAAGMAVAMLIGLWIKDEWMFDKQFDNYKRIAGVWQTVTSNGNTDMWTNQPSPLAAELRKNYGSDFRYVSMCTWNQTRVLMQKDKRLSGNGIFCEQGFTKMFSLKMQEGTDQLTDPHSILLSASLAKACFGNEDPVNKTLLVDNKIAVVVSGVYKDMPVSSSFAGADFLMPWELYARTEGLYENDNPWRSNSFRCFVQLADHVSLEKASEKIRDVKMKNVHQDELGLHPQLFLYPMSRWHLFAEFRNGVNTGGLIRYVWLLGVSGVFVLLLACINFMNLSTARSEKRAREVGIRKAIGSQRSQLIGQFFSESMLMVSVALVLSLVLVQLFLPIFNDIAQKRVSILWTDPLFWFICIGFSVITGLIAGSYPAFYLSSFRPVKVLKGTFRVGRSAVIPRRVLVVLQFTVSVILIIATVIVFRQVQFGRNRPIGYDRSGLVMLPMYTREIHDHFDIVRNELLKSGAILNMAESWSPVTGVWSTNSGFSWEGKDPAMAVDFPNDGISIDYGKTVGWRFKEGRDFSRDFATDTAAFVVNETAARFMGLKDPVGKTVMWDDERYTIIGIIKDVVAESPFEPVRPSFFHLNRDPGTRMLLRLNPGIGVQTALDRIAEVLKKHNPNHPFDYQFVDQEYARKFGDEQRFGRLTAVFSVLAIFISCLGLFGMATFMAEQRTREIGVRKVLGATLFSLWRLLSTDFVVLVTISLAIAFPLAYYAMNGWLRHYQYRTGIPWWLFPAAGAGTLLITLLTVSFQAIRASLMNPVKSLRTE